MKPIRVMLACIVFAGAAVATVDVARAAEPISERVQIQTRTKSGAGQGDMTQERARQRLRFHQDGAKNATEGGQRQLRDAARRQHEGKGAGLGQGGEMRRERARLGKCDMKERRAQRREHRGEKQQGAQKQCKGSC